MIKQIHFNTAFNGMTLEQIEKWIEINRERLIGSAIFTNNNSVTSKIVRWAESWGHQEHNFIPSHTGSIVEYEGQIYVFDMKPLKSRVQLLSNYLCTTKDTFALVLRDFKLDTAIFSNTILDYLGEWYPFMSAIRSVFSKSLSKRQKHCSELHLYALQLQDIYKDLNPEITPDELWHVMIQD